MSRPFHCPTRVHSQRPYAEVVRDLVGGRRWALATSAGWVRRGAVDLLRSTADGLEAVIGEIPANPKISDIETLASELPAVDVVIALGGGSAIDAAKGLVALQALRGDTSAFTAHLREGADLPADFAPVPIVAVPTTSGTGSEITRWATVWGDDRVKFSLHHPRLYPADAILDPTLCTSMNRELTLASGLDALSHAMEAVWNVNHTAVSDHLARDAIATLSNYLDRALDTPEDVEIRRRVQLGALIAGFAMGTTQTALAHSISYAFTAHFGMPHGLACSFTLPEVARYNSVESRERLRPIAEGLGCDVDGVGDFLDAWYARIGIGRYVASYVSPEVTDQLGDHLITRARAGNNLRAVDGEAARVIARTSLERILG